MSEELLKLAEVNPIRKVIRYRDNMPPMIYLVGKPYGGDRLRMCNIELVITEGKKEYYFFVQKRDPVSGEFDKLSYLWKTEKAEDITVEYDLDFDEL